MTGCKMQREGGIRKTCGKVFDEHRSVSQGKLKNAPLKSKGRHLA